MIAMSKSTPAAAMSPPALPRPAIAGALACLALSMLLSSLGTSVANVALPAFVDAFRAPFLAVQWIVLAYLLAITTLIVSVGRLGDLVGRRRLMLAGIAVFTLGSVACGLAPGLWVLVAARALQGAGAAVMMTLSMAMVGDAIPPGRAGSAMGFLGATSAIGTALGPSLGGLLIAGAGWPAIFLVNVPLGFAALLLASRYLPRDRPVEGRPTFDYRGSLLLVVALAAYALSMTFGRGSFGIANAALLLLAGVATALFLFAEARARSPLVRPALFRQQGVGAGFAMSGLVTTVAMTTLVVGPFYLARALHLAPAAVGLAMTAGPLVAALTGVPAGRGVDLFGARRIAIAGLVAMACGALGLALISPARGIPGYVLPLVVLTAGFAMFQAANNTAVMAGTSPSQRGVVSGLLNLSRNLGLVTGASVMGAVFAIAGGSRQLASADASAVVSGTHAAFAVAIVLVAAALLIAVGLARQAKPGLSTP
jgi:EmrB/QacA subfamily drug resistance transporter